MTPIENRHFVMINNTAVFVETNSTELIQNEAPYKTAVSHFGTQVKQVIYKNPNSELYKLSFAVLNEQEGRLLFNRLSKNGEVVKASVTTEDCMYVLRDAVSVEAGGIKYSDEGNIKFTLQGTLVTNQLVPNQLSS